MAITKAAPRNAGLDLLRLLAILLVLGNHLRPLPGGHGVFISTWMRGGWVGVDLFFVLSGFLVSGLLFKEHARTGRVSIGNFLIRRGLKIYPAFWALIGCSAWVFAHNGHSTPPKNLWGELLFVQNYAPHMWPHTWSLAIEEHFYLLLVGIIWLMLRTTKAHPFAPFPRAFFIVAFSCLAMRTINFIRFSDYNYAWDYFPTHLRIDSLFFGALLAYLMQYHDLEKRLVWFPAWARIAIGAGMLAPAFIFARETDRWITVIGFNLFYLGAGLLVLGAIRLKESTWPPWRLLAAFGATSYSIYLWHVPVNYWFAAPILSRHQDDPGVYWQYVLAAVGGALLAGYVMARVIEFPILHLRDRFWPTRSGSVQSAAGIPADDRSPAAGSQSI